MTPDEFAEDLTAFEIELERLIARGARFIPEVNAIARALNLDGKDVRACECDCIDAHFGAGGGYLVQALCEFKMGHQAAIEKAKTAPIPIPQPRSGR